MKRLAMILTAAFALAAGEPSASRAQTPPAPEKTLAQYREKNRVLLVFAPTAQDAAYVEQTRLWKNEKAGFEDRQLVVVPVLADARPAEPAPGSPAPAVLEKKFGVDPKSFAVVLIGKDGHDAYRAVKPVKPEALYGVIDAMPMRRAEVKRPPANASPTPAPTPRKPDLDHDE